MSNSKLFPLALLYIGGDSIDGATRFQKLVFLSQRETDLDDIFQFNADKYGPFSKELAQTLDILERKGLIEKEIETTRAGHERYQYCLTQKGRRIASSMARNTEYEYLFSEGEKIKKRYNQKSLDTLLKYVYRKYPKMTKESELDVDNLFSEDSSTPHSHPPR